MAIPFVQVFYSMFTYGHYTCYIILMVVEGLPIFPCGGIITLRFEDGKIIEDSLFHPRHELIKGERAEPQDD